MGSLIRILAEPPSFIHSLPAVTKVAEGDNVTLSCTVAGTPKPIVSWRIGNRSFLAANQGLLDRDHHVIDTVGQLVIIVSMLTFLVDARIFCMLNLQLTGRPTEY